jgi:PAS domain S-box-containing protein
MIEEVLGQRFHSSRRPGSASHSEQLWRAMFDGAAVPMAAATVEGILVDVNAQFCQWLGYGAEDLIGRSYTELADPDELPNARAQIASLVSGEIDRYESDRRYRRADGRWVWARLAVSGIETPQGEARLLAQMVDITDRKQTEHELREELRELRVLEETRAALDEHRLEVYAQPVCDLLTGAALRQELLVRMRDPDGAIVPPDKFLPAAERAGLIGDIDRWMIGRGIDMARLGLAVNINLSSASLSHSDLLQPVERAVAQGVEPGTLAFEITETAMAADLGAAIAFSERASALGCPILIDDFGVGFGSLTYVQQLRGVCCLKIDRAFVTNLTRGGADQHIVTAVVNLADSLGQHTVAEGIESQDTLELLRGLGVDSGQGYLLGAPQPAHLLFETTG